MNILDVRSMLGQNKSIYDLPLRVAYYARVSTEREEQLNSLESQVMYFENLIKKENNWQFIEGYVDEGITGVQVNKRDSFLKMIRDSKLNKFDLLITKEVSRFARNTLDSIKYTRELLENGVGVYFLSDNISTYDPDSELRLTIMASMAQEEIRKLSDRVRFGYQRSVEKGIVAGSNNILGYTKNKGKLIIDENQAKIIKTIFEEYSKGEIGTVRLSDILYNEYGFTNSKGNPIHSENIRDIIRNPKYKGYYCANKGTTLDFRTKKRMINDKEKWVVYKDFENVPPIVSEELWNKCNDILEERSRCHSSGDKTVYNNRYPLSQKLYCMHDNCLYIRGNYKLKKRKRVYWGCDCYRTNRIKKSDGCNSPLLYEEELSHVFNKVTNYIIDNCDHVIDDIYKTLENSRTEKDYKKEKDKIKSDIKKIRNQIDNLINMRTSNEISSKEFNEYKIKYNNKIIEKETILNNISNDKNSNGMSLSCAEELKKAIKNLINIDDKNSLEIGVSLFNKIVVEVNRDKEKNAKAILHCHLKTVDSKRHSLPLSQFSLLNMCDSWICSTSR